LKLQLFTDLG